MKTGDIVKTDSRSVSCDGGKGALGHPAVYLRIPPKSENVVCPYCSREFVLVDKK